MPIEALEMMRLFASVLVVVAIVTFTAVAQQPRTTWSGIYTNEQAARGEKLYAEQCAQCHGDGLGGVESAPALTGDMFNSNWEGVPLGDLLDRIRISMPQNKPGSLSRAQTADIVAHMLKVGGFPSGETPLDGQAGALSQTKFVTYKPQQ
jgi:mono/diheme cytochrome c family protein